MRHLPYVFALVLACGPKPDVPGDDSTGDPASTDTSASSSPTSTDPTQPTTVTASSDPTVSTFTTEPPTSEPPTTVSTVTTEPPGTAGSSVSESVSTSTGATDSATDETGGRCSDAFLLDPDCPDMGGEGVECDVWSQDCPDGQKCSAWADNGGTSWNATKCVPLADNPAQPGDVCSVEGSGVSGIDTCDGGNMCFFVDQGTNMGTCVPLCTGSPDNPACADPNATCIFTNEGVLNLCLQSCDPDAPDCDPGQLCQPVDNKHVCLPA